MWYSQMVKVNGLLPALGPAGFYGPYKLTYLLISNQPLILLRFPSPRDSHKHSPTTGNRLVARRRRLPVSSRCGLVKNKKSVKNRSAQHLQASCTSEYTALPRIHFLHLQLTPSPQHPCQAFPVTAWDKQCWDKNITLPSPRKTGPQPNVQFLQMWLSLEIKSFQI